MHIELNEMTVMLKKVFDKELKLSSIEQIHGGAQKVVYKVSCENGFTCILYVWDLTKNYLLRRRNDSSPNHMGDSFGAELFEYNIHYLSQLGIRVPHLYLMDRTQSRYPFDFAIVEDVGNIDLSEYIQINSDKKVEVLTKLDFMLKRMHEHCSQTYGQLNKIDRIESQPLTCEHIVLHQTLKDLDHLAENVLCISENKEQLTEVLDKLYLEINLRNKYGLIHGELGPDHIRVDPKGNPILIDIEGCKFFDIEYEHAFLEFRFGENYRYIRRDDLDQHRQLFYKFHLHISCSSGPLKIIKNGFPDSDFMRKIIDYNVQATLAFLK